MILEQSNGNLIAHCSFFEATFGEISATPASDANKSAGDGERNERDVAFIKMGCCRSFCAYSIATLLLRFISIDTSLLNENTTNLVCWEPLFESILSFVFF
jgi:hypothetical protein